MIREYDYDDIEYPIPFNDYYQKKENRYDQFGQSNPVFASFVKTGKIEEYQSGNDLLFVIPSSDNHFLASVTCILSIIRKELSGNIAYVDLGLHNNYLSMLNDLFIFIHSIHKRINVNAQLIYRKFSFDKAPTWMNIKIPSDKGGYAWKPIPMIDLALEWKACIVWMDAGNLLLESLDKERKYVEQEGFYSFISSGTVAKWVHPYTLNFLKTNGIIGEINMDKRMCGANHVFFDYRNETIRKHIIIPYYQCGFTKKCISPKGTSRENHRQDQAVLTALIHNLQLIYSASYTYKPSIIGHRDGMKWNETILVRRSYFEEIEQESNFHLLPPPRDYPKWYNDTETDSIDYDSLCHQLVSKLSESTRMFIILSYSGTIQITTIAIYKSILYSLLLHRNLLCMF